MKREDIIKGLGAQPHDPFVWFDGHPILEQIPPGTVGVNANKIATAVENRPKRFVNLLPMLRRSLIELVYSPQMDGGILPVHILAEHLGISRFTIARNCVLLEEMGLFYKINKNGRYAIERDTALAVLHDLVVPPPAKRLEKDD
ncbi:hypothetical protein [Martelella mangrovi]|uniref:Biotin operon repressor n=1 Tax=Martelella mangrovi TaxID=1397477 RepID=A0ABV2ICQ9_9HYPH